MYKKPITLIIILALSTWFWAVTKPWLYGSSLFAVAEAWIQPLVGLLVLSSLVAMSFLLMRKSLERLGISLAVVLPFFLVFGFNYFFFIGVGLSLLVHLYAGKIIKDEEEQRNVVNTHLIMRRGLPIVMMPLFIMISFGYYFSPKIQSQAANKELPPTVNEVIERTVSTFLGDEIRELPEEERESALNQLITQVTNQFIEFVGPYFQFMPPILAFGLFLVLEGLSFIFVWLTIPITMFWVWLAKRTGLAKIKIVQIEAEQLEF
ncbi:MAG: hypothetical protein COV29_00070 [Candidatus Yanofskybacteria bacterium CG10_big_fil_rev_8_21_14_0_10_36_16]|uniref:Uncharacterized protein n=1 Tax=Candidatus Yanofskybacteria bacterium CG10_big_fil_rev_8_21_14_0_10_36_16 TaxID=1975096 RepID=A0A2J0QBA1_9BACT|nr:MAG: hypothetical protein COV29_00070 [Candidatus Yanofskybacteria bacterium CG10_big_fil_rev_8_21_14_0_10_36_16]